MLSMTDAQILALSQTCHVVSTFFILHTSFKSHTGILADSGAPAVCSAIITSTDTRKTRCGSSSLSSSYGHWIQHTRDSSRTPRTPISSQSTATSSSSVRLSRRSSSRSSSAVSLCSSCRASSYCESGSVSSRLFLMSRSGLLLLRNAPTPIQFCHLSELWECVKLTEFFF